MGVFKVVAIILLLIPILGICTFIYQAYSIARSISVVNSEINFLQMNIDWSYIPYPPYIMPIIRYVILTISLTIRNPTDFSIEIESIHYKVYIEGIYVGKGSKGKFVIMPGSQKISFSLSISTDELSNVLKKLINSAIKNGFRNIKIHYKIEGTIDIPIKLFNTIKLPIKVAVPFDLHGTYTYVLKIPKTYRFSS